jgi:hypothetical protein
LEYRGSNLCGWRDAEVVELGANLGDRAFQLQADDRDGNAFSGEGQEGLHGLIIPVFSGRVHDICLRCEPGGSASSEAR